MPRFGEPRGQRLGLVQVSDVTCPHVHVDLSSNTSRNSISNLIQTIKPVPGQCDQLLRMCDESSENTTLELAIQDRFHTERTNDRKILLIVTSGRFRILTISIQVKQMFLNVTLTLRFTFWELALTSRWRA